VAAEVGQLDLAYDYLGEAALIDLHDLHHNVQDGVHMASLAGVWTALVAGFGGLRAQNSSLCFAPRLPETLKRLAFNILFRGRRLRVEVRTTTATYRLLDGSPLVVRHHGEEILLPMDGAVTRPIPPIQAGPRPTQPPGRAPIARGRSTKNERKDI
jgi:alpha,alpha-trehalose phosphorylase